MDFMDFLAFIDFLAFMNFLVPNQLLLNQYFSHFSSKRCTSRLQSLDQKRCRRNASWARLASCRFRHARFWPGF